MSDIQNLHEGHKKRLRQKAMDNLDSLPEHEVLELILNVCNTRKNMNPLAHQLLNQYGNISGVMEAEYEDLILVKGVGEATASFIKLIPALFKVYKKSKLKSKAQLRTTQQCSDYFCSFMDTEEAEEAYAACLNRKFEVLSLISIGKGDTSKILLNFKKILKRILLSNCPFIVIAHSHTNGLAYPSVQDHSFTENLLAILQTVKIKLIDHVIVATGDTFSYRSTGVLDQIEKTGYNPFDPSLNKAKEEDILHLYKIPENFSNLKDSIFASNDLSSFSDSYLDALPKTSSIYKTTKNDSAPCYKDLIPQELFMEPEIISCPQKSQEKEFCISDQKRLDRINALLKELDM